MDRRFFLKVTGLVAGATALGVRADGISPHAAVRAPGAYQITGRVQLREPLVEISGITNAQQISWSGVGGTRLPVAGFTSFEHFEKPWTMPAIDVRGGRLESLAVVPVDLG